MPSFADLLTAVAQEPRRAELSRLAETYSRERREGRSGDAALDTLLARIRVTFRAARYPVPDRTELVSMIARHFGDEE